MKAEELKAIRHQAGWTQAKMAEAIGVTANYLAMMERGEKAIERRTEQLIEALAQTRIDVSYSKALGKWVVAVVRPSTDFAGRVHHLVAAENTKIKAKEVATDLWEADGKMPRLTVWPGPTD